MIDINERYLFQRFILHFHKLKHCLSISKSQLYAILIGSSLEGFLDDSFHLISQPQIVSHSKPSPKIIDRSIIFLCLSICVIYYNSRHRRLTFYIAYHEVYEMKEKEHKSNLDHQSFQEIGTNYTRPQSHRDFDRACFLILCASFFQND